MENQNGGTYPQKYPPGTRTMAERGPLQRIPTQIGTSLYRPHHRLGHRRHERPPMGRHDAGRRKLCRSHLILQTEGSHHPPHRIWIHYPHPPGTRCRKCTLLLPGARGRHCAGKLPFRHHQRTYRGTPGIGSGLHHRRSQTDTAGNSLQRQCRP